MYGDDFYMYNIRNTTNMGFTEKPHKVPDNWRMSCFSFAEGK